MERLSEMEATGKLRTFGVGTVLAVGALIIGQFVVLIGASLLQFFGVAVLENRAVRVALGVVLLQGVTFGGIALGYLFISNHHLNFIRVRWPTLRDVAVAIGGSIGLFVLVMAISAILSALNVSVAQNQIANAGAQSPIVFLLLVPLSYLLVGPGEELLYRGLIQGLFKRTFGTTVAIFLASGLFAVIHVFSLSGQGKIAYILIVFLLALILGAAYDYTDNLAVPAFIHGTYNAVQFGAAYVSAVGGF